MTDIVLLDGGMGQELVARSGDAPTPLWATQVMVDHPGIVADIHRDYLAAGATVATTNSYALHHDRFAGTAQEGQMAKLVACSLAEAATGTGGQGRIAGAIGPLSASYRPDLHPEHAVSVEFYAEIAELLQSGVDLILCETVASVAHARAVLEGARRAGKPVWLSVTVDDADGRLLRSREKVSDLSELEADAWLANCSVPEVMAAALAELAKFGKPFGAYANGFTHIADGFLEAKPTVDSLSARHDLGPETYADYVMQWVDMGATIVGGCCEIGPAHIAEIAKRLTAAGHKIA